MARKRLRQHFRIASLETCSARHGVQLALTGRQHRSRQIPDSPASSPRVTARLFGVVSDDGITTDLRY
jgi:hypothetical protein